MLDRFGASLKTLSEQSKYYVRLCMGLPIQIWRVIRFTGLRNIRLGIVSASWGKRWFLQVGKQSPVDIRELRFELEKLLEYEEWLDKFDTPLWFNEPPSPPESEGALWSNQLPRFSSLMRISSQNLKVCVYYDNSGSLIVRDGLRRLAVARRRGLTDLVAIPVVPVKMLSFSHTPVEIDLRHSSQS